MKTQELTNKIKDEGVSGMRELTIGEKAKKLLEMREEMLEYAWENGLSDVLKLQEIIPDDLMIDKDTIYLPDGTKISKITNIKMVSVDNNDYEYTDIALEKTRRDIFVARYRGKGYGINISFNPFQKLVDKKNGSEFFMYNYCTDLV
ncbi:MAG: hypothetical protein ACRCW0_05175 [Clostridium sp.]